MENNSEKTKKMIDPEWRGKYDDIDYKPQSPSEQCEFEGEFGKTIPYKKKHFLNFKYSDDILFFDFNHEKILSELILEKKEFAIYVGIFYYLILIKIFILH